MKRSLLLFIVPFFMISCNQNNQNDGATGDQVALTFEFLGNQAEGRYYDARFVLENKGEVALGDTGWALYVNQQGSGVIQESVTGNVLIEHVNGDLLRISPKEGFQLEPGDSVEIAYRNPGWMIKESEVPLAPFMVYGDETREAVLIGQYEVLPFPPLDKIFPPSSGIVLPDAAWVYEQNSAVSVLEPGNTGNVLPTPVREIYSEETVTLDKNVKIVYHSGLKNEAGYLAEMLEQVTGTAPEVNEGENGGTGMIFLQIDKQRVIGPEAYELHMTASEGIMIAGESAAGVFYGIQTLLSVIPPKAWGNSENKLEIRAGAIMDQPAFEYRGFHLDVARNFIEPDDIKRLIDIMAFYKLNKLHLHLTDDEGWRLEIPSIPELTQVGAYRGYTEDEKDHLIPAYGSGPDPRAKGNHGSGYISRESYIELLQYADARHIQVIPEINFPGHARAAIKSMETRYERLMREGKQEEAEYYRLIDPQDTSRYSSAQIFNDNVICVCTEGPYRFYETVVDDILEMYSDAGLTLTTMHTGGDEVPRGVWRGSPICQAFLEQHPEIGGFRNLQAYFGERMFEILNRKGLVMAGWEEVAMKRDESGRWIPNPKLVGESVLPYVWNSLDRNLDLGNRLANAGFPVVLCNVNNFYFDLAYTHHPAERGQYWGGFVRTRSAFEFIPFDVFKSTLYDKWGRPFDPETDFKGMERLKRTSYKRVIGLQAELWSETVKGGTMAEYYYLPKLIGFAERAWVGQADWGMISNQEERVAAMEQDWNRFANIVGQREMPRLDYIFGGYNYRLPPPGAMVKEGKLNVNIDFPGLAIRYTTDGSEPVNDSPLYTGPIDFSGKVLLKSFNTRGRGSRTSKVEN
jgi:hexosaminidase